ncbi:MAG TPA: ATP-binding cassette domain-containing protein [Actinocrinis sp.]|nr:ATP-binding cassette domain-containing protein [Actinocrinis sp.]
MIEARALTKRYGSTTAVDDLSFTVVPGRVTGFLGPNGAGKSTTMRMIVGLDRPTSGTVTVNGEPFQGLGRALDEVGALLDARAWHGGRSAYHHLLCLAQSNGIGRGRVQEVLGLVGLSEVAGKRAGAFSLGMGQRLGLAAALLGDPGVVICDEPVNGLDPDGISWIRALLRSLAAEGRTILVSSHLMSEMAQTADHLIVIGKGRLLADASMAEVIAAGPAGHTVLRTPQPEEFTRALRGRSARVEAGIDPEELLVHGLECAAVGDLGAALGLTVHGLAAQNPSLEDAYLELTRESVEYRISRGHETGPNDSGARR